MGLLAIFVLGVSSLIVGYLEYLFINTIRKANQEKHSF